MRIQNGVNIWLLIILASCSAPIAQKNTLEDKFADIIKNSLKDNASKNGTDFNISSLSILKIDTITSVALDSQIIIKTSDRLEICNAMADLYLSMSATGARIRALDKKMKKTVLPGVTANDMEDDTFKARVYKDSARYYERLLDSLNTKNHQHNRLADTLYQIRSFLQATEKNNIDSTNHFGITYYYITKDNRVFSLSDVESGKLETLGNQQITND